MFSHPFRFLVASGLVLALSLSFAHGAAAEGRLKEWLKNKRQQEGSERGGGMAGFGDLSDKGSCAERVKSVEKMINSRFGSKIAYGPAADIKDVAYGPKPLQALDVFLPAQKNDAALAPVIVMVHGGGWCTGDKKLKQVTQNKVKRWTPRGFVFISVNYPMITDGSNAQMQAEDIAKATAFIQQHAHEWGGDGKRVILMGHSAGAHLVSLVNADGEMRARHGIQKLLGTVSLDSGATNVVTQMPATVDILKGRFEEAFGTDPSKWEQVSPYHRLDKTAAPWLGVCATARTDDPCGQAKEYADKSNALGIAAGVLPQENGESMRKEHSIINDSLGVPGDYTDAVEDFMASLDPIVKQRLGK